MNPLFNYTLKLADDTLILGQRLGELCGQGPYLEEDIALTNIALDYLGQSNNFYKYAAQIQDLGKTEDDLAFLRLEKEYWAVLQDGTEKAVSKTYLMNDVVDKAGSGDCFMAGLIYGLLKKNTPKQIINFAAAAATGKLYEHGDATRQTTEQVNARI